VSGLRKDGWSQALGSFQCCDMVGRQLGHLTCEKPAAVIPDISVWGNLPSPK